MPILGILASSITGGLVTDSGAMFPIQSVVVPSAGATQITFNNIPSTYSHLQLRCYMAGTYSGGGLASFPVRFNSDSGANYAWHELYGTGSTAGASTVGGSQNQFYLERIPTLSTQDYIYGTSILDILDYTSTTKAKTVRQLAGVDKNGSGEIYLASSLWNPSTPVAITRIDIIQPSSSYTFRQYSSFALFGVKA